MEAEDYYCLLNVSRTATMEEVKKAYRKLAMQFHPDVNTSAGAEDQFKKISEAYAVLSDTQKRQEYDLTGGRMNAGVSEGFGRGRGGMGMGRCRGGMGGSKCNGFAHLFRPRQSAWYRPEPQKGPAGEIKSKQ